MTTNEVRSLTPLRSVLTVTALLGALSGLAGVALPTAHADAVDDRFIAALTAKGINVDSPQRAIIAGHEVCDELDLGRQKPDVAAEVMQNSNLDSYKAGYFVGLSVAAFCPRQSG
jgi:maleate cis-trans isomerase